jgi:hypothetical protein
VKSATACACRFQQVIDFTAKVDKFNPAAKGGRNRQETFEIARNRYISDRQRFGAIAGGRVERVRQNLQNPTGNAGRRTSRNVLCF